MRILGIEDLGHTSDAFDAGDADMTPVCAWTVRFGVVRLNNDFRTIGVGDGIAKSATHSRGKEDDEEGLHCRLNGLIVWADLIVKTSMDSCRLMDAAAKNSSLVLSLMKV